MDLIANESPPNEFIHKVQELGSAFTSSVEACQQQIFSLLGGNPLDAQSTAKMITAMITTESSFSQIGKSNWDLMLSNPANATLPFDGTIFVAAVRAMAPSLDWTEVCHALDNPYFWVRSKAALQLLTLVLISGIAPNPFPIGLIYRPWSGNRQGQLSWLGQIVQHPDVFYVLDYPHQPVGNLSCLKVFPDEMNRNIGMWKCQDLVDILFRIAEVQSLSNHVLALLRGNGPINQCPDLLLLGVIQINTLPNTQLPQFRIHIIRYLITTLLSGNANAVPVLQFAWNFENNKQQMHQILLAAIGNYYAQNSEDQSRLTRILEIAHEIKALTELFSNMDQLPFVIDLAILAARRDFLKLDKFIEDKLAEHGERFAQQLCEVMKRRSAPGIHNPLPNETFQLMFSVLQPRAAAWPIVATELSQLMRSKAMPGMGSTTPFGAAAAPFIPKMSDSRVTAGTPVLGSTNNSMGAGNQFTLFQRDQMMRNLRSTPANEFRDFRPMSSMHSSSPNNALDFGGEWS